MLKRLNTLEEGIENAAYEGGIPDTGNESMKMRPTLSPAVSLDTDKHGNRFKEMQHGTIDVWWLYDDGGMFYGFHPKHIRLFAFFVHFVCFGMEIVKERG